LGAPFCMLFEVTMLIFARIIIVYVKYSCNRGISTSGEFLGRFFPSTLLSK
jgi:hypothetical protein